MRWVWISKAFYRFDYDTTRLMHRPSDTAAGEFHARGTKVHFSSDSSALKNRPADTRWRVQTRRLSEYT